MILDTSIILKIFIFISFLFFNSDTSSANKTETQTININKDNSRNYKTTVLEAHKEDEDIKYYLDFIFNPFIITGISDKKLNRNMKVFY